MKIENLSNIDWDAPRDTASWTKLLNELLILAQGEQGTGERGRIADALDQFADHSTAPELDAIGKLDAAARKAARALRIAGIEASIAALRQANSEFQAAAKEIAATQQALDKEASKLRLEAFTGAVTSLTDTIASLKKLSRLVASEDPADVGPALEAVVSNAQKLRALLEKSP